MKLLVLMMVTFFYSYYDCLKTERRNVVFQGIVEVGGQTENAIKHRINAGDKGDDANDKINFRY